MKTTGKLIRVGSAQFELVESGIYRNITSGTYFYRAKVRGKRTWRSLATQNLKHAREELYRRRSGVSAAEVDKAKASVTLGEILQRYRKDGYPDRQKQPRVGRTLEMETRNITTLLKYWDKFPVTEISLVEFDRFRLHGGGGGLLFYNGFQLACQRFQGRRNRVGR